MGTAHGRRSLSGDPKESLRTSAALRRRIASVRLNVPFCFQPVESGINGSNRHLPARTMLDLLPHRHTVGSIL